MPKSKSDSTPDRTTRAPRDPSPDRDKSWRPSDGKTDESDGGVDREMEIDTGKYDAPRKG